MMTTIELAGLLIEAIGLGGGQKPVKVVVNDSHTFHVLGVEQRAEGVYLMLWRRSSDPTGQDPTEQTFVEGPRPKLSAYKPLLDGSPRRSDSSMDAEMRGD